MNSFYCNAVNLVFASQSPINSVKRKDATPSLSTIDQPHLTLTSRLEVAYLCKCSYSPGNDLDKPFLLRNRGWTTETENEGLPAVKVGIRKLIHQMEQHFCLQRCGQDLSQWLQSWLCVDAGLKCFRFSHLLN